MLKQLVIIVLLMCKFSVAANEDLPVKADDIALWLEYGQKLNVIDVTESAKIKRPNVIIALEVKHGDAQTSAAFNPITLGVARGGTVLTPDLVRQAEDNLSKMMPNSQSSINRVTLPDGGKGYSYIMVGPDGGLIRFIATTADGKYDLILLITKDIKTESMINVTPQNENYLKKSEMDIFSILLKHGFEPMIAAAEKELAKLDMTDADRHSSHESGTASTPIPNSDRLETPQDRRLKSSNRKE